MITENDFADAVDQLFPDNRTSECGKYRDITEAARLFELAKKMAIEFALFRQEYQRIEGQNVRHYCRKHLKGMVTWKGADDKKILEAYIKGEQLEDDWVKEQEEIKRRKIQENDQD